MITIMISTNRGKQIQRLAKYRFDDDKLEKILEALNDLCVHPVSYEAIKPKWFK